MNSSSSNKVEFVKLKVGCMVELIILFSMLLEECGNLGVKCCMWVNLMFMLLVSMKMKLIVWISGFW